MQKKFNLVLLAIKMVFLGYIIDGLNCLVWKSAVNQKRKNYRLLMLLDSTLHHLKEEFDRIEKIYLLIYASKEFKIKANE